jgi:hypothetical protein
MMRCFDNCEKQASEFDLSCLQPETRDFIALVLETVRKARLGLPFKINTSFVDW